jgi:hypothetical protein
MANPRGQQRDNPFRDALRMELAAIGEDHKAMRIIARNLIAAASDSTGKDMLASIKEIADRLDGKPAQAIVGDDDADPVNVSINDRDMARAVLSLLRDGARVKDGQD